MKFALIGRSEILYETGKLLIQNGHELKLVISAKEAPEYTKTADDFEVLAAEFDVPFFKTAKISQIEEHISQIGNMDIAISYNYSGIIPQSVIDLFPLGILNGHGGDLPRYRGNACQAWAILNGEERIAMCVHKMIGGELDSGDIITRRYRDLNIDTTITELLAWMADITPELFLEATNQLSQNASYILEKQSKDPASALRCYPRLPCDGKIDWKLSNENVVRLINASTKPYSGAFCEYEGHILTIWSAKLADSENYCAVPGQVTHVGDGYIEVACGTGKIRINKVEFNGLISTPDVQIQSIRKRLT